MPTVRYLHVTDGRMDGRTTYDSNTALAVRASHSKNCRLFGIDDMLLEWIKNLSSERTFQTRVKSDFLSALRDLLSGVIQGNVLGPLMFLIYT